MWRDSYLDRFYPLTSWRRDGTRDFFEVCRQYCTGMILEVGAGPSNRTSDYLGTLGELHGVDIDSKVKQNAALRTASVIKDVFPFPDCSFDSCVSNYVCEHITDSRQHLQEIWRVLKPSGIYVFRTPNKFHYTALGAAMTPHSFHVRIVNRLRATDGHDQYPTHYLLNSRRKIRKLADIEGFEIEQLRMVEKEPSYGMSSKALFLVFMLYERAVNSSALFSDLRANLFVVLRKANKRQKY